MTSPSLRPQDMEKVYRAIPSERRRLLIDLVRRYRKLSLKDLSDRLGVSTMTIRRDVRELGPSSGIHLEYGGLVTLETQPEPTWGERSASAREEKAMIGRAATKLLSRGESIILGPGTTTLELARHLPVGFDLTVITNNLSALPYLRDRTDIQLWVLPGQYRHKTDCVVGPLTEQFLINIHVNRAFLGIMGLDLEYGLSTYDPVMSSLLATMAASARETVLLADHTKFGLKHLSRVNDLSKMNQIITDDALDEETFDEYSRVVPIERATPDSHAL